MNVDVKQVAIKMRKGKITVDGKQVAIKKRQKEKICRPEISSNETCKRKLNADVKRRSYMTCERKLTVDEN